MSFIDYIEFRRPLIRCIGSCSAVWLNERLFSAWITRYSTVNLNYSFIHRQLYIQVDSTVMNSMACSHTYLIDLASMSHIIHHPYIRCICIITYGIWYHNAVVTRFCQYIFNTCDCYN